MPHEPCPSLGHRLHEHPSAGLVPSGLTTTKANTVSRFDSSPFALAPDGRVGIAGDSPSEQGAQAQQTPDAPSTAARSSLTAAEGSSSSALSAQDQLIIQQEACDAVSSPECQRQHHGPSVFSGLGRPCYFYPMPKRRVWSGDDIPLRWRQLRVKAVRGTPGIDPQEVAHLLAGGFWEPSACLSSDAVVAQGPQGLQGLSKFMQAQIRVLQQEAEEVVQLIWRSKRHLSSSITSSRDRLGHSTGAVLQGSWRLVKTLLCCCWVGPDEDLDGQTEQGAYEPLDGTDQVNEEEEEDSEPGGDDGSQGVRCDSECHSAMHAVAEREFQRRISARMSVAAEAVLRWGRADPLRTPILAHNDSSSGDLGQEQ